MGGFDDEVYVVVLVYYNPSVGRKLQLAAKVLTPASPDLVVSQSRFFHAVAS